MADVEPPWHGWKYRGETCARCKIGHPSPRRTKVLPRGDEPVEEKTGRIMCQQTKAAYLQERRRSEEIRAPC
jgi:hypothetical protein